MDLNKLYLNAPHSMGTTIIGVTYNEGVVLGADSRTSTGEDSIGLGDQQPKWRGPFLRRRALVPSTSFHSNAIAGTRTEGKK
ncbi:hypothetical protein I3843_Q012400 [Carya illinoinensis]|nr:hypothetical protein I3843_Q012400 [Carya illinoinensis]